MSNRKLTIVVILVVVAVVAFWWMMPSGTHGEPSGTAWESIASTGATFTAPPGWVCHDPFTSRTPVFIGHTWLREATPYHFHQAALICESSQAQIFLVRAGSAEIEKELQFEEELLRLAEHPLVECEPGRQVPSADGVTFQCLTARMSEGIFAGDATTYFIGIARLDEDAFVINAGGLTGHFEPETAVRLIQSLRLRR